MAAYLDVWQPRLDALSRIFGEPGAEIFTALPPIYAGGGADVIAFPKYKGGVAHCTAGLTGGVDGVAQRPNRLGHYELVLCTKEPERWAPDFLSHFAKATLDDVFEPGETMDFPFGRGSRIETLLFAEPELDGVGFEFSGTRYGLLLLLGLTKSELNACMVEGSQPVMRALKDAGVFPWTDMRRGAIATSKRLAHLLPSELAELDAKDDLDERAARFLDGLLSKGALELVNDHGRTSLLGRFARILEGLEGDVRASALTEASAELVDVLMDAPEVAEVFMSETELRAELRGAIRR